MPFADIIYDKESKEACKNRLREYFIEAYNEIFINIYLTGKVAVRKLIVILGVEDALTAICADSHNTLKKDSEVMTPIFHTYDSQVGMLNSPVRTTGPQSGLRTDFELN